MVDNSREALFSHAQNTVQKLINNLDKVIKPQWVNLFLSPIILLLLAYNSDYSKKSIPVTLIWTASLIYALIWYLHFKRQTHANKKLKELKVKRYENLHDFEEFHQEISTLYKVSKPNTKLLATFAFLILLVLFWNDFMSLKNGFLVSEESIFSMLIPIILVTSSIAGILYYNRKYASQKEFTEPIEYLEWIITEIKK
jgi:hypothetical protein